MVAVRFVFTYMLFVSAVELLLLVGGAAGDGEFFFGAVTALPVTILWWVLPEAPVVAAYVERIRATGLLSRQLRPATRSHVRGHVAGVS